VSKNILYEAYEAKTTMIYNTNIINDIIFNANCMICARFKDYLIYDERTEFLKKFNDKKSSINLIKESSEFYLKYSKVFPNYILLPEKKYMFKGIERKQKCINERHNELIKKSNGEYLNSNSSREIFNEEFLKKVEKSLTRNKVSKIDINPVDTKTCEMKELLDKYMENDTLYESFKNQDLLSLASDYCDSSFAKKKEDSELIKTFKSKIGVEKPNDAKIIIALSDSKKGIAKHQRVQSSSNAFKNNISPSTTTNKNKPIYLETKQTCKKDYFLRASTNKRNEKDLKMSCTIKPRSRANSNRKTETKLIPTSTKINTKKTFNQFTISKKENINSHLTSISPTKEKGINDIKERRINFESVPKAVKRPNVKIHKDCEKNYIKKNLSVKKLNSDKGSLINNNSREKQKINSHHLNWKKITDMSRHNTLTTSGKTLLFKKGDIKSNIPSPKEIHLVYNTARNLNSRIKI